jgi:hypothetical protein
MSWRLVFSLRRWLLCGRIAPDEPNFDLAWQVDNCVFVAEVKSLTAENEEKQLRLGLGQVLRYAYQLSRNGFIAPVLVVERCPRDLGWEELCRRLGIILAWPEAVVSRLLKRTATPGLNHDIKP